MSNISRLVAVEELDDKLQQDVKEKNELLRVLEADDLHGQFQKLVEALRVRGPKALYSKNNN